jgi:hypothetical protein
VRFYLDTEFNGHGGDLISLALIADGAAWYAAQDPRDLPESPRYKPWDPWVAKHVIPVLGVEFTRPLIFRSEFQCFIQQFSNPEIICDWHVDAQHFCSLLQGPDYGSSLDFACRITILKTPPGQPVSAQPHNALADARALMKWNEMRLAA